MFLKNMNIKFLYSTILIILLFCQPIVNANDNFSINDEDNYILEYSRDCNNNSNENYKENYNLMFNVLVIDEGDWYRNYNVSISESNNETFVSDLISIYNIDLSQVFSKLTELLTLPHVLIYQHPSSVKIINTILTSFFIYDNIDWIDNFKADLQWKHSVDPVEESKFLQDFQYSLYSFTTYTQTGWSTNTNKEPDQISERTEFGTNVYIKNLTSNYFLNDIYYQPNLSIENTLRVQYFFEKMNHLELDINTYGSLNQTEIREKIKLNIYNTANNETFSISFDDIPSIYSRDKTLHYIINLISPFLLLLSPFLIYKFLKRKKYNSMLSRNT